MRIEITGDSVRLSKNAQSRFMVRIDDKECPMTYNTFSMFVKLVHATFLNKGGWVNKEFLTSSNATPYIWKMRRDYPQLRIISDRRGNYRLDDKEDRYPLVVISEKLLNFDNATVRQLARELLGREK